MKILDTEAMSNAVKKVVSLCGIQVLADEFRFQSAIRDFLPSSSLTTEQQLLIFSIRIGIGGELLKVTNKAVAEQNRMLIVADALLTAEYGFMKERSDNILDVFVSALGWQGVSVPKTVLPSREQRQQIGESKSSSPTLVRGTIIPFGNYKWRVLYVKKKMALLISDEITDIGIPYNRNFGETTWASCSLRDWLNTEFLNRFTQAQQSKIVKKSVRAEANPWYQTDAGVQKEDKVFLLSISDVVLNFGDSGQLKLGQENPQAKGRSYDGLSHAIDDRFNAARCATYKGENTWWWLRSPGESQSKAAYVNANGLILLNGELACDDGGISCVGVRPGVRPAIWLQQ